MIWEISSKGMNALPPILFEKIDVYTNVFYIASKLWKRPIMQDEKKGGASMFFVTSMKLSFVKIELGPFTIYLV